MQDNSENQRTPLNLLMIEDLEDDALLVQRTLQKGGYDITLLRVENAKELSEALTHDHWDIVISDYNLPGFDSTQGLAMVREANINIPFIIVSGTIGEQAAVTAMKMGANDYLMKDNITRLAPAIERELREAEKRGALSRAEATIRHMAFHDALTGLVNRVEFERRLQRALKSVQQSSRTHVLLYLDLDQFKLVNDTCGHIAGDELLRCLTVDLLQQVRARDTLARLGGDEFGVLLENCSLERAEQIAETIRECVFDFRFIWQKSSFSLGASIGLVVIDETCQSTEEILSAADMACYAAKDRGRNRIQLYSIDDIDLNRRQKEMQWPSRISQALQEQRFALYQHTIMALNGSPETNHREFLVRMIDENGAIVLPGAFIPAAERYNIMTSIDRWVIDEAFRLLADELKATNIDVDSSLTFINLSANSLSDKEMLGFISARLQHYQLPAHMICFEITESAAITDFSNALNFITSIKNKGCRFALDDFGSGMSSYSYLKRIPVDFIKIDGSFVKNIERDEMDRAIVTAITQIAHVSGIKTVAEFVQNKETITILSNIGVDFAQGYGIDKPRPVNLSRNKNEAEAIQ